MTLSFIFFSIFGPKIGFLDTSVFMGLALGIAALLLKVKPASTSRSLLNLLAILLIYGLFVCVTEITNNAESVDILLRTARATLVVLTMLLFYDTLVKGGRLIAPSIFWTIVAHTVLVIIIAVAMPDLQLLIDAAFGHYRVAFSEEKERASGLMAGFEIAGLFSLIAMLAVMTNVVRVKHIFIRYISIAILFFGIFFTSRTIMVLALSLISVYFFRLILFGRDVGLLERLAAISFIVPVIGYVSYQMILVLEVAMNMGIVSVSSSDVAEISARFSGATLGSSGLLSMYFLPEGAWNILFGTGIDAIYSDVGYVKFVFWNGFVGLALLLCVHLYLFMATLKKTTLTGERVFVFSMYFLVFFLTFKNNYLLTRGIWPVLILFYIHFSWKSGTQGATGGSIGQTAPSG